MRSFLSVFQLDPQTVQSKNWHMDVIEMNGVRFSSEALSLLTTFPESTETLPVASYQDLKYEAELWLLIRAELKSAVFVIRSRWSSP